MSKDMDMQGFKGSANWAYCFMQQKNLRVHSRVTVIQAVPNNWEGNQKKKREESFFKFTAKAIKDGKYSSLNIISINEVP